MTTPDTNECGSGAGCLHKDARIEHLDAEVERLRAQVSSLSREAWTWSKALESQLKAAQVAPAGSKLVPVEPTPEMLAADVETDAFVGIDDARRLWAAMLAAAPAQQAGQAPAVTHGSDMLEPLIYAAMMHNGKPKTVAEFERVAANVADMLQRRAADAHEKPVASIYISADGSREFDDWRVDLPPGNHQLFTAPRPAQPQPESLPHPGAPEAEEMIDKLLAEYQHPANAKNAARAGYMAARRLMQWARKPLPSHQPAQGVGELPPLPEAVGDVAPYPDVVDWYSYEPSHGTKLFTAVQMRDYARAALAQAQKEQA